MPAMTSRPGYICDAAVQRSFMVNGISLHALEWGQPGRPALCFLHGGSAHAHWFDAVVPAFVDRFHVISLDQRGHGESGWAPDGKYGTEQFASDLREVMDAMRWGRVVVVGHSMGGHNAMGFSAWYPDRVRGLCVVDSRPSLPAERLEAMHRRGHRGPRRHETLAAALASFRLLPSEPTGDTPPNHPDYDRLWSAVTDLGMVPIVHVGLSPAIYHPSSRSARCTCASTAPSSSRTSSPR